ncbi:MAG: YbaB/EbfC family nucleoid-associated protein [Gemmatimonadales bacterium]
MADPTRTPQTQPRLETDRGIDAERARQSAEATAGAGLVRVRVDGRGTLRSLVIAPEAFDGRDADLLADLVMAAVSEAQRRLDDHG